MKKDIVIEHAAHLTAGRISRRKFIMTALAAGATLPMAMSIATNAIAATPAKGGLLRQGHGPALPQTRLTRVHQRTGSRSRCSIPTATI